MNSSASNYDAIVVGGGHNGLVAASYLAKSGMKVLVLERREMVGGACYTEEIFPGFRFSSCSYVAYLLQSKVVNDLELRKHGLEIHKLDPHWFMPFEDGRYVIVWEDVERTAKEISRVSPEDGRAYPKWLEFWDKAARVLHSFWLRTPPTLSELVSKARELDCEDVLERILTSNAQDIADEFFVDENIKGFFTDISQDLGDPKTPGTALSLAYFYVSDLTDREIFGIPKGGMGSITQAMERAAKSYGATTIKEAEVERILVKDGQAKGVKLKDGKEFASKIVISNADPKRTFLGLVGEDFLEPGFVKKVEKLRNDTSCLKFHSSIRELPDFSRYLGGGKFDPKILAHVFPGYSVDYARRSWEDAMNGRPTRHPIIQVQIPTVYDPTMAPPGKHVMSMWVRYAPYQLRNGSWEDIREREGEFLIDTLSNYAPNIRNVIIDWQLRTPLDLERMVYLTRGNIRHLDMIPSQTLWSRPMQGWSNYKTPIKGLYLCGAGTHPGGEVTGAPGHNAAHVVLQEFAVMKPEVSYV